MTRSMEFKQQQSMAQGPRDLRRFWRILTAVVVTAGPLSIWLVRAVMPYWTTDSPATIVDSALGSPGTMSFMVWSGLLAMPVLLGGVLGAAYVARRGAPILAMVGAVLCFVGWSQGGATVNADYVVVQLAESGFAPSEIVAIGDALQAGDVAAVSGIIWLVGHIVGMIIIGIALGRAGIVHWWVAIALMVSQPFHLIAAVIIPSRLLDLTMGWGLTAFASFMVSLAIVRMSNDEWDLPPLAHRVSH
ncbi:hypothetical protein ACX80D_15840 [Arthrobacter sp. Sr24]